MDTNFVHFSIVLKKFNFRPIILENMGTLKKASFRVGYLGQHFLLQLR